MEDLNKKIAAAIQLAHKLHEQSYVADIAKGFGDYTVSWERCWQLACETHDLSNDLWFVLHLANHWLNDLGWWAEQILAGKSLEFNEIDTLDEPEFTADDAHHALTGE